MVVFLCSTSASCIWESARASINISLMAVCFGNLLQVTPASFSTDWITGTTRSIATLCDNSSITHIRSSSLYFPPSNVVSFLSCNCLTSFSSALASINPRLVFSFRNFHLLAAHSCHTQSDFLVKSLTFLL